MSGVALGSAARAARNTPHRARKAGRGVVAALGSSVLRAGALPGMRQNQLDGFSLSGTVPQVLLRPGINTLLVEVVAGRNRRVHHSVGFVVVPAAPKPGGSGDRHKPPRVGAFAGTPPPKGVPASHATVDFALPRERKEAAAALAGTIKQRRVSPLTELAKVSPKIAQRLHLPVVSRPQRPPKLKKLNDIPPRKEGEYA